MPNGTVPFFIQCVRTFSLGGFATSLGGFATSLGGFATSLGGFATRRHTS